MEKRGDDNLYQTPPYSGSAQELTGSSGRGRCETKTKRSVSLCISLSLPLPISISISLCVYIYICLPLSLSLSPARPPSTCTARAVALSADRVAINFFMMSWLVFRSHISNNFCPRRKREKNTVGFLYHTPRAPVHVFRLCFICNFSSLPLSPSLALKCNDSWQDKDPWY